MAGDLPKLTCELRTKLVPKLGSPFKGPVTSHLLLYNQQHSSPHPLLLSHQVHPKPKLPATCVLHSPLNENKPRPLLHRTHRQSQPPRPSAPSTLMSIMQRAGVGSPPFLALPSFSPGKGGSWRVAMDTALGLSLLSNNL